MLHLLKKYSPRHDKYTTLKNNLVDNASKFYERREKIIEGFKNEVFPLYYDREGDEQMEFEKEEEQTINDASKFNEWVNKQETDINNKLFKKHFKNQRPSDMFKLLYEINDKEKTSKLVSAINSRLKDLKEEIKKMSKEERKIKKPDKIVKVVKKILRFNKQNQKGKGLKILTPSQMISRLPITLAELKAGNNSEKIKNEIRQLLYSLYRSKNMTKQVYNNLIKYIRIK